MRNGSTMRKKFPITCEVCAKPVFKARAWAKYCSPPCRMIGWVEGKRDAMKIHCKQNVTDNTSNKK